MVACMVVRVAAQDIEHQPPEQFAQRILWPAETMPDDFGQVGIAGIAGHHFIKPEDRQRRDHGPALPAIIGTHPVEPFNQQHVLPGDIGQAHWRNGEPGLGGEPHGDEFRLHHIVGVRR